MKPLNFVLVALLFFLVAAALSTGVTAANNTIQDTPKLPDPWNNRTGTHYTTIQAAINDAQPGDTIIAETGTYTENIKINKTITLKAQGTPTIQPKNPNQPTITITANNTTITGFTIKNSQTGIHIQANQCKITNNNITNNTYYGIYLDYSSNNTISNNNITNNGLGIDLSDSEYNKIYNNNITNNGNNGIDLRYSSNNTISNNNITNNGLGIDLWYSSNNILSNNNITNNTYYGIYLNNSSNNTIYNNKITNNKYDGIYICYSSNNILSNNNITNNGLGIDLWYSSNNILSNNNITNNTYYGIYLFYSSNNNMISNNKITNNGDDGIDLWYSSNNTISNNNITNNGLGIDLSDSEYNKIYNNNITNNDYDGIDLRYSSNNNLISNNNITNSGNDGIYICYSSNNTISNNTINNMYYYGIYLYDSSNNTISNNNITNNGEDGIYLYDSSNNNTISNNNITNNKGRGIFLYGDNNIVYRNSFIGNGVQAIVYFGMDNLFNLAKPTGGNYWSDYTGKDLDGDGFGDTPYTFTGGQDNLPLIIPKINSIDPANGAVSVPSNKTIIITFNQNILKGPSYANITVKMANGTVKTINKTISGNKLYIKAIYNWNPGVKFTVTIPKNAIKNSIGSMLATDYSSTFTVAR